MSKRAEGKWGCITVIALLICGCALPYGFLRLTWGNAYTMCFGTPFPSEADVEKNAFFQRPPSARDLVYDASGGNDSCTIWATFELAPEELAIFQASTLIKDFETNQILSDENGYLYRLQQKDWTQPVHSVAGYAYMRDHYSVSTHQWVMIDTADPNNFTVYIIIGKSWL